MSVEPVAGVKRAAPGKSSSHQQQQSGTQNGTPAAKKAKLSPVEQTTPATPAATVETPAVDNLTASARLPSKILDAKPLPTLPEPQPATLPDSEYQSIAASAVLATSIARSQQRWTGDGIFERYWRKPETGKNARPPPPNNPDPKCIWRRSREWPQPRQSSTYSRDSRRYMGSSIVSSSHTNLRTHSNNRATCSNPPRTTSSGSSAPAFSTTTSTSAAASAIIAHAPTRSKGQPGPCNWPIGCPRFPQSRTQGPDEGIFQKHIDELQRQIKEEQDAKEAEEKRKAKEAELAKSQAKKEEGGRDEGTGDRSKGSTPLPPASRPLQQQQQQQQQPPSQQANTPQTQPRPAQQPYTPPIQPQQTNPQLSQQSASNPTGAVQQPPKSTLTPTPTVTQHPSPAAPSPSTQQYKPPPPQPPPGPPPVILSFSTPNSTEDRFLFPRTAILERLTDNHHLVSFLVTRKGSEAASFSPTTAIGGTPNNSSAASAAAAAAVSSSDLTSTPGPSPSSLLYPSFDPEKTYYQPVTLMLEVKFGLETLVQHVRRWLLPEDQAREGMEKVMRECERAPEGCLPLRLPVKSAAGAGAGGVGLGGEAEVVGGRTPTASLGGAGVGKAGTGSTAGGKDGGGSSSTLLSSALKKSKKKGGASASAATAATSSTEGSKKGGGGGGGGNSSKADEAKPGTPKTPASASASASASAPAPAPAPATVEAEKEQKNGPSMVEGGEKSSKPDGTEEKKEGAANGGDAGDKAESARPKRSLRKSVRISEGHLDLALLSTPTIPIRHARPPPLPPRFGGDDNLPHHHHEHSPANLSPLMQYTPRLHNRLRVLTTTTLLFLPPPEPDISTFNLLRSNTPPAAVTTRRSTTSTAATDPRHESGKYVYIICSKNPKHKQRGVRKAGGGRGGGGGEAVGLCFSSPGALGWMESWMLMERGGGLCLQAAKWSSKMPSLSNVFSSCATGFADLHFSFPYRQGIPALQRMHAGLGCWLCRNMSRFIRLVAYSNEMDGVHGRSELIRMPKQRARVRRLSCKFLLTISIYIPTC
ncbi:hypothetical protein KC325_g158 [Hortaea werneckii]|nr:hypothetical protein KC325_g158 [Hortaea werneckii]